MEQVKPDIKFGDLPNYNWLISCNDIDCYNKELTSLVGAPENVSGYFSCGGNQLTSLIGGPKTVGAAFDCSDNPLTDMVGAPEIIGGYLGLGGKTKISLHGITTKQISGTVYIDGDVTGILELFKIRGITRVNMNNHEINYIVNKYLQQGIRGMLPCQAELIAAGYKDIL